MPVHETKKDKKKKKRKGQKESGVVGFGGHQEGQ
jgi:hypothetical protein